MEKDKKSKMDKWLNFLDENDVYFLDKELEEQIVEAIKKNPNALVNDASMNNICCLLSIVSVYSFFEITKTLKENKMSSLFSSLLGFSHGSSYYSLLINRFTLLSEHEVLRKVVLPKEEQFFKELLLKYPPSFSLLYCSKENNDQFKILEQFVHNNVFKDIIEAYQEKKQLEKIVSHHSLPTNSNKNKI